jgi:hypothetical protein
MHYRYKHIANDISGLQVPLYSWLWSETIQDTSYHHHLVEKFRRIEILSPLEVWILPDESCAKGMGFNIPISELLLVQEIPITITNFTKNFTIVPLSHPSS